MELRWRPAVALTAAVLLVAAGQIEAQDAVKPSLTISGEDVTFQGPTEVTGPSNIKDIGQGTVQVRDKTMRTAVLIGTSTRAAAGPAQRIQPVEGKGVAITSGADTGGAFVSAASGRVGINDASSKYDGTLHIAGDITSDFLVAPFSGTTGPAVLLDASSSHNTVLVGKPESARLKYALGRGQLMDRTLTVSVPSVTEYDGAGKPPYIVYQSPNKVLAAFKSASGDAYMGGNMGVGKSAAEEDWKSGTKTNMHVYGEIRMETKGGSKTQGDGVAMYYRADGKNPSFNFRTGVPTQASAVDTRMYITGTKDQTKVGINTIQPKSQLDVRGHLSIEGEDRGNAMIYYPASGAKSGFYIRGSAEPKPGDVSDTRFFITTAGHTGINTIEPKHGLCLMPKKDTEQGEDLSISKGSLHLKDGVRDMDGKHVLSLDGNNNFKDLGIETGFTVGSDKAHQGTNHMLHVQGSKKPTLLISQKMMKPVSLLFQTGKATWTLQGTSTDLNLVSSKSTQDKIYFTKEGNMVVGDKEKPEFALQIETQHPENTHKANDIYLAKGGLNLRGGIFKKSMYKGQPIVWRLHPEGFSNMKDLGISDNCAIGTEEKHSQFKLYVEKGRSVDMGGTGFVYTTGSTGTVSFNEYVVTSAGQQEKKLHDKQAYAAAVRFRNDGVIDFEGTADKGILKMTKLMSISPPTGTVTFEKYADFGMAGTEGSPRYPLRVKGGSDTLQSTIAFGHISNSMGLLGSTSAFTFLGTSDEKKFLAIQHSDGKVGLGTTQPTEELTVRTKKANSDIHFTSDKTPGKVATLRMEAGGSTKLSTSPGNLKSAKFEVKEFTDLRFTNAGNSAETIFDRGNPPPTLEKGAAFEPPTVEFRSGKVGMGVDEPEKHLHIGGDHWSQGLLILKGGMGQSPAPLAELSEMIEVGEGSSLTSAPDDTNVLDTITALARLVRRNKRRLQKQVSSIEQMEGMLARLSQ